MLEPTDLSSSTGGIMGARIDADEPIDNEPRDEVSMTDDMNDDLPIAEEPIDDVSARTCRAGVDR